jgi:glycolate oxidase FAD binding subunit
MTSERVVPLDLHETEKIMQQAAARGDALAFAGGGTEWGFGYPPERVDVLLDTTELAHVVEYAPADMVVEVEGGMRLAALQRALAKYGQRLAIDPPESERATIGGLLATNAFGPRRLRFGSLRDLIVGVTLIRADGVRVRGGGKVVKNVAGFDLPKIAVGSLGSLGLIATATFRLHPLAEVSRGLHIADVPGSKLRAIGADMIERRLEPSAAYAVRTGDTYEACVLFEGFDAGVAEQCERFAELASEAGLSSPIEEDATAFETRDANARTGGEVRLRIAVPPASVDLLQRDVLDDVLRALPGAQSSIYPALGIAFVSASAPEHNSVAANAIERARALVEAWGGNLVVLARPEGFAASVDVFGTLPPAFALMAELKQRFDPDRRLARGRFIGHL